MSDERLNDTAIISIERSELTEDTQKQLIDDYIATKKFMISK